MPQTQTIHIPICYASDENYAKPLTVSMYSVLANTDHHIDFFILDNNISLKTKEKMRQSLKQFNNFSLTFIPTIANEIVKSFPVRDHFTITNYFRYFIPELCPDIAKCIYLDVDIILTADISELFAIDLDGYLIGAVAGNRTVLVRDFGLGELFENLGLSKTHNYFGSGVMLMDLDNWRTQGMTQKMLSTTQEYRDRIRFVDQDVLNIVFDHNNFKDIGMTWHGGVDGLDRCAVNDYKLIHYYGLVKPWDQKCPFDDIFWGYAINTVFYQKPSSLKMLWSFFRSVFCMPQNRKKYKRQYFMNKATRAAYAEFYI